VAGSLVDLVAGARGPDAMLLDPFCGSGTVLVEAFARGVSAIDSDLSPLAVAVAAVKTRRTDEELRQTLLDRASFVARRARDASGVSNRPPPPRGERDWYPRHTLAELCALRDAVSAQPEGFVRQALWTCLSSILVKVSYQRADSDPGRVDKRIPRWAAVALFKRKAAELVACLHALADTAPASAVEPIVRVDDALALRDVGDASVDAIVSSPPYVNTYDYARQHAARCAWLGLDVAPLTARELGAVRYFRDPGAGLDRTERDLTELFAAFGRVLRPGGAAVLVVGDGVVAGRAIRVESQWLPAAERAGLRVLARVAQPRPAFREVERAAFRSRPKLEHTLWLERPASASAR
jgi:methylase of polypeptide subunit release factors